MADDIGLAQRLVAAAFDRYAEGRPEPGDAQLILSGSIHTAQHDMSVGIATLTDAVTTLVKRSTTNGNRRIRDRAREAAPPVLGIGGLAAVIAWFMEHFRPG